MRRWVSSPAGRRMARFAPAAALAAAATQITYFVCVSVVHIWQGLGVCWLVRRGGDQLRHHPLGLGAPGQAALVQGDRAVRADLACGWRGAGGGEPFRLPGRSGARAARHRVWRFCAGGYLAANGITFIARFVVFNFVVFADRRTGVAALYPRVRRLLPELARFSIVGALVLLVSGAVTTLLQVRAGAGLLTSGVAAVVLGVAVSYAGNRYWTFRHR